MRKLLNNQKGLTLIEMLIAILIFILAAVFIVSLVTNALDKPKVAGIMSDFNHYEQSSDLLLRTMKDTAEVADIKAELNKSVEKKTQFDGTDKSSNTNAYNNNYELEVVKGDPQTTIQFVTTGKSDSKKFKLVVVKEGKTVESCTTGFGRNNKKLKTLLSPLCDDIVGGGADGGGNEVVTAPVGPSAGFKPVTVAPDGCIPVTTAAELDAIRLNITGCYTLMNPIDLSGYPNWEPLQGPQESYILQSTYNYHISRGVSPELATTYATAYRYPEFRGSFDGQRYPITGLTINKTDRDYMGLFGVAIGSTFKNIALENVSINGKFSSGGIVGSMKTSGSISDSYVTGSVYALNSSAGALVGETVDLTSGSIKNSYSSANVTAKNQVGGLIGYTVGMVVDSSYFSGTVTGGTTGDNAGGIAGYFEDGSITNSNSSGVINARLGAVGGLVGNSYTTTISKSFATGKVNGYFIAGGLIGNAEGTTIIDSYATGEVSGTDYVGGLVGLTAYGGGSYSTVTNTHSTGVVNATDNRNGAGGLIGTADETAVSNSYATGTVTATSQGDRTGAGGLIGSLVYGSTVADSYSTGSVTSVGSVGGLVGFTNYGASTISDSYALGSVTNLENLNATKYPQSIGGFVGRGNAALTVTNSYARGDVTGVASGATDSAGGFIGKGVQNITLTNVYSTGKVLNSPLKGGLVGQSLATAVIADSYYNSEISGLSDTLLGTPKTTSQLQQKATFTNWDFGTIWKLEGSNYPTFQ